MKKTFLKRRLVEVAWIVGIAAAVSYMNWQIDQIYGSVVAKYLFKVLLFTSLAVILWYLFSIVSVVVKNNEPSDSLFYRALFKYKWVPLITSVIILSILRIEELTALNIVTIVFSSLLIMAAAIISVKIIYSNKFWPFKRKISSSLYSLYEFCIFAVIFAAVLIAINYFDDTETNMFAGLGPGMLAYLGMVGLAVAGGYALILLAKRIALVFGIQLGGWGSDRALDRFIAARQRRLAGAGGSPLARSRAQILLGLALGESGRRNGDADAFRKSAQAFRAALPALRQAGKTSQWALTQSNLATSLFHLNRHEIDRASLEGAIEALRAGAEGWNSLDDYVSDWANGQFQLCGVLTRLGALEDGTARLAEAVAAGKAALAAQDHSFAPLGAAKLQINLSEALAYLGERENGAETLEEAAATARNALRIIDEDKDNLLKEDESIEWRTMLLGNLGHALRCLGERREDPDSLREAADALRSASELRIRRNGFDRAIVQDELARTLRLSGERDSQPDLLTESLSASDAALKTLTRRTYPFDGAQAATTRAETLATIGARTRDPAPLRQAVDALTEALAVFEQAETPVQTRRCREILDRATALLDELTGKGSGGKAKKPSPPGPMKPRPA